MDILFGAALSLHLAKNGDEYNFIHPHLRLEHDSYIAGAYYNSIEAISLYAGKEFELSNDTSLEVGIVTGYYGDTGILPFARVTHKDTYAAPHIVDGEVEGIVVGFEWLLNSNR